MATISTVEKISNLRAVLKSEQVDGFLIPRADEYQGEYVPANAERLKWATGFTGSAGFSVVLKDKAAVLTDGRYTIQVKQQTDPALFDTADSTKTTPADWIAANAGKGDVIGYDPRLHTPRGLKVFQDKGIALKPLSFNPVDAVWKDRPAAPASVVELFPMKFAGIDAKEKLDQVAAVLKQKGMDAAPIILSDSIAWLLNIRANDIPHIPVALSYGLMRSDGTFEWFIEQSRVPEDVRASFGNRVSIVSPDAMEKSLGELKGKKIGLDENNTPMWFSNTLLAAGAELHHIKDPAIALKAIKNEAEQSAMRAAHIRDGVAVTRFVKWLDEEAPKGKLTEMDVEAKLEEFRRKAPEFREPSFDTIASTGPNGAIIHYRVTPATNRPLDQNNLLLLDSGAQYEDGTTDITRTIAIGTPSREMIERYTHVLRAHIAVDSARFPYGTTGAQIDAMGRGLLWKQDMDFMHGTGHGVGCYLSVHEAAASLSPRGVDAVEEGMILSNEPGFYKEGAFGIRIENLILSYEDGVDVAGRKMLAFETLTFVPMDMRLIDQHLLSDEEKKWLHAYHKEVFAKLEPYLDAGEKRWLTGYMAGAEGFLE